MRCVWYQEFGRAQYLRLISMDDFPSAFRTSKFETRLYHWLWLQRSRIWTGNLPQKFLAALQDAHPLISEAVAIAEPNSLNMRSDKELVK